MKISLYNSFITNKKTLVYFNNGGKYGHDFREAKIGYKGQSFILVITDGYNNHTMQYFTSLKLAINKGKSLILQ